MKNIVGPPARRNNFYQREREIKKIISRIEDGNNIHIAAPRRIGKTSILYHLLDNKINQHVYVYVDTEAVDDEQAFFKKLLKEIVQVDEVKNSRWLNTLYESGNKFLKTIKSIKFLGQVLDFHEAEETVDYKEDLENLLSGIELKNGSKLILLIDEFPQTIQNIVTANPANTKPAIQFLQSNRELRLNPEINSKIIFVYTGSIGLNHTVSMIDGSAFVNDLNALEVDALTSKEAIELLYSLLAEKKLHIQESTLEYVIGKIEWLIPFYIQLAAQEIICLTYCDPVVTTDTVDKAFENMIAARNNNHFDDYYARIKKHFKMQDFDYAIELLCKAAESEVFSRAEAFDLSIKYKLEDKWRHVLEILMYDGYINNVGDKNRYRFNSPILKMWWQRFICK